MKKSKYQFLIVLLFFFRGPNVLSATKADYDLFDQLMSSDQKISWKAQQSFVMNFSSYGDVVNLLQDKVRYGNATDKDLALNALVFSPAVLPDDVILEALFSSAPGVPAQATSKLKKIPNKTLASLSPSGTKFYRGAVMTKQGH